MTSVLLTFDTVKNNNDVISVLGKVPLPVGSNLNNTNAVVTIGGFTHNATLTSKGLSTDKSLKLTTKTAKTVTVKFG